MINFQESSLLLRKNIRKIPNELIYRRHVEVYSHPRDEFIMFSTKTGEKKGFMVCSKLSYPFRDDYNGQTLGIDFLVSYDQNKNYGSKLLNFAKNFSKQSGCNGYICLKSDSSLNIYRAPHQFYRKNGFTTLDKKTDRKIDRFNKRDIQGTYKDFKPMLMFYPKPEQKKTNVLKKIYDKFMNFYQNKIKND